MQGALEALAAGAGPTGRTFHSRIRILIPSEESGVPPDVLSEDFAHRVDRRVAEVEEEGFPVFRTQRQYVVPVDVVASVPDLDGEFPIGSHPAGGGGPGTGSVSARERTLGSEARARFHLEDVEEGAIYEIEGVQYVPGERYAAIVVSQRRAG